MEEVKIDGNTEIQKALKEFEEKSAAEQNSYKAVKLYNETNTPKIVKLVMKYSGGAIKEERQAEYVLLGFVVVAMGISIYLFFGVPNWGKSLSINKGMFLQHLELMKK